MNVKEKLIKYLKASKYKINLLILGNVTLDKDCLGEGGNGIIYKIKTIRGDAPCDYLAIKFLISTDSRKISRFKDEYLQIALKKPEHAATCVLYDEIRVNDSDLVPCIVMRRYSTNLAKWRSSQTRIDSTKLESIFTKVVHAVASAHSVGIIHRDIKPENILLDDKKNVYLADFGIAYFNESEVQRAHHTRDNERLSNRSYSAPEQENGNCPPDKRMDIYSTAMIGFYLVHGQSLRGVDNIALPGLKKYERMIQKGLSTNPEDRPDKVEDLIKQENGINFSACLMTINFRNFLTMTDPNLYSIQNYREKNQIIHFLNKFKNYKSDDLWHLWDISHTMHFLPSKIKVGDYPFVQFAENRFKIAEMWLICDRACSQCDGDFIMIRYESYDLPNNLEIEYRYHGKLIPEVQALNGYIKADNGNIEKIDYNHYEEIVHNNQAGLLLIGPRLGCFTEAADRAPRETSQLLEFLTQKNNDITDEDIANLCSFFRRFHNSDVMATA